MLTALTAKNLIGLVVTRAEGGWQASIENARGSWSDGPVCDDPDAAVRAVLGPEPAVQVLPPPPSFAPPPPY